MREDLFDLVICDGERKAEDLWETVLKVEAENVSPAILGGPDTRTVREVNGAPAWWGVRPTALRGVWRWWVRALLAGLLWEKGRCCDYRSLAVVEAKELGLGSIACEEVGKGEASKWILNVDVVEMKGTPLRTDKFRVGTRYVARSRSGKLRLDVNKVFRDYMLSGADYFSEPWKVLLSIPRYALLVTGNDPYKEVPNELYFRQPVPPKCLKLTVSLRVRRGMDDHVKLLCSAALVLALTLGGIGQATSRGFGKMSVNIIEGEDAAVAVGREVAEKVLGAQARMVENILKIMKENSVSDKLVAAGAPARNTQLPPTPALHPSTVRVEVIRNPEYGLEGTRVALRDVWGVLAAIGRACLKIEWKKLFELVKALRNNLKVDRRRLARISAQTSGRYLHTWPLGLPRYVSKRDKSTGYAMIVSDREVPGRLASLVRFTPLQCGDDIAVVVYAFKTKDLSRLRDNLYHLGYGRRGPRKVLVGRLPIRDPVRGITQRPTDLTQYLNVAFETVVKVLTGGE